jgi:hypothetical protein
VLQRTLAAQVPVEGPQARGLALQRRGGRRRPAVRPTRGQLVQEARQLGVAGLERVDLLAREVGAVLQQVGPVRLERVARQAALELQVGQEVQQLVLEAGRPAGRDGGHAGELRARPAGACPCKGPVRTLDACAARGPGLRTRRGGARAAPSGR